MKFLYTSFFRLAYGPQRILSTDYGVSVWFKTSRHDLVQNSKLKFPAIICLRLRVWWYTKPTTDYPLHKHDTKPKYLNQQARKIIEIPNYFFIK